MEEFNVDSLSPELKLWFANAIVGMITADGVVTDSELEFLRYTINFLDSRDDINKIIDMVKRKEKPLLQSINIRKKTSALMLLRLAEIAVLDGRVVQAEVHFFEYVGSKLGLGFWFTNKVIEWAKQSVYVKRRKKELIEEACEIKG